MNLRNLGKFLVFIIILFLASKDICQAGFGISPPAVSNSDLMRGSHYEQKILLIRGEPKEDLKATATIAVPDFPEVEKWISIDQGTSFILPKGINQFPIIVSVDVPKKAAYKNYKGYIDIRTEPIETGAQVSIALGARIQLILGVSDKPVPNFEVRSTEFPEIEECCSVKYLMKIENTGNVKTKPSKVEIKIFDGYKRDKLLKTAEVGAQDLDWVKSYKTKVIVAKFPVKLEPGRYWAEVSIFKEDKIIREDKTFFSVSPGKKILGLTICTCSLIKWVVIVLIVLAVLGIAYGGWKGYKRWTKRKNEIKNGSEEKQKGKKQEKKKILKKTKN